MDLYSDDIGITFTASGPESVEKYNQLVGCYMGYRPETGNVLKELLALDPDMPMAMCMKGYFAKMMGSAFHSGRAVSVLGKLDQVLAVTSVTGREQLHAEALRAWCQGQLDAATRMWEEILLDCPWDFVAMRLAHFNHFYSGDGKKMRDSIARVLPRWNCGQPGYGYLLGMYAFGLEESGEYGLAEQFGRRAVEINPQDAWSVHAVTHVFEMQERHAQGIEWISGLESSWSTVNNFRFHLYWHQCLFHLERGEIETVLDIYDTQLVSDIETEFYLDICNATSLLWRLEMFGADVGDRWQRLADISRRHIEDTELIFVSLHYLMPLLAIGDDVATQSLFDNLGNWASTDDTQARVITCSGMAIAEGLHLARKREYRQAVDKFSSVRTLMSQVGGSKAQRDVFSMTMLDCARRGNLGAESRALYAERVATRPGSSWAWSGYSEVLESAGAQQEAQQAANRAREIADAGGG